MAEQLQAQLAEWRALQLKVEPARFWLEGRIAFSQGTQKVDLEVRKRELDSKAEEARQRIAQVDADIAALADPSADGATCRAIQARLAGPVERVPR